MQLSILIPAFRAAYLRQAIASALTQGFDDFELVISDDSGGEEVRRVVERFGDPRIRYLRTAGRIGAAENCKSLWREANADRLLFLLDDDLLMPHAAPELMAQLDNRPDAAFGYGQRYIIDAAGRILQRPPPASKPVFTVQHAELVSALVGKVANPIGELSNVIINRGVGLTVDEFLTYRGVEMVVVGDVACFLNISRKGPVVGLGIPVAAFRKHGAQNSSPDFNPTFAVGICEWELFIRGEYAHGSLSDDDALRAAEKLATAYRSWSQRLPIIADMAPSLDRLLERIRAKDRDVFDVRFLDDWSRFVAAVKAQPRPGGSVGVS